MSKDIQKNNKLQLEVSNHCITKDGFSSIELTVQNHAHITQLENEPPYSLVTTFKKRIYLLDKLLLSIYSKVYKQRTENTPSFFLPIELLLLRRLFSTN